MGQRPIYGISLLLAFLFVPPVSKRKAGKELCVCKMAEATVFSTSIATFSLQEGAAKKKLTKRNGVFVGAAHTCDLLKKVDQTLSETLAVVCGADPKQTKRAWPMATPFCTVRFW